ncbi:hypothetical protein IV203_031667 [Nitzschia inconspicua]|uniref:Uncharacterized protein n=1 Tax=Nitzschia inconspicua TaxID=303405 RepID=A0A9K3Q5A1_9STRA|nr:hypothetical protein IV203_031667 [Nitzschia inconspicua]
MSSFPHTKDCIKSSARNSDSYDTASKRGASQVSEEEKWTCSEEMYGGTQTVRIFKQSSQNMKFTSPSVENATIAMREVSISVRLPECNSSTVTPHIVPPDGLPQHAGDNPSRDLAAPVSPYTDSPVTQERENFLIFIKILFKILDDAEEPHTKRKAKQIVLECRRKNQQGDPLYHPLMDAVESRLRRFVGEASWRRAHLYLNHYISTRRQARNNQNASHSEANSNVGGSISSYDARQPLTTGDRLPR